jgi:hypothetical protein
MWRANDIYGWIQSGDLNVVVGHRKFQIIVPQLRRISRASSPRFIGRTITVIQPPSRMGATSQVSLYLENLFCPVVLYFCHCRWAWGLPMRKTIGCERGYTWKNDCGYMGITFILNSRSRHPPSPPFHSQCLHPNTTQ